MDFYFLMACKNLKFFFVAVVLLVFLDILLQKYVVQFGNILNKTLNINYLSFKECQTVVNDINCE